MPHRTPRTRPRTDAGFSLVEVLVAMVLFGVLLSTVLLALGSMLGHARNNQNRTVAATIATRMIDRLHAIPAAQLPTGALSPQTVTSGGTSFTVNGAVSLVSNGSTAAASACDGGGALSVKSVHVEVTWTGMRATKPVVSDTLRQLTVTDLDLTKGNLNLLVTDRDGNGVQGRTVTLSPAGLSTSTDPDGCASFATVPAGGYTVALAATPGWVDPSGASAPSHAVTITGGSVTKDPGFSLDRSASVAATWTPTGTTFPVLPGTGITLGQAAFTGGSRAYPLCGTVPCADPVPAATGATGATATGLFPFATGYRVWAGTCADAAPSTQPAAVVPAPAGSSSTTAPLAPVTVTVKTRTGTATSAQSVLVTHVADAGCPSGISSTVTATAGSSSVKTGLPTGSWTVSSAGGAAQTVVVRAGTATSVTVNQP